MTCFSCITCTCTHAHAYARTCTPGPPCRIYATQTQTQTQTHRHTDTQPRRHTDTNRHSGRHMPTTDLSSLASRWRFRFESAEQRLSLFPPLCRHSFRCQHLQHRHQLNPQNQPRALTCWPTLGPQRLVSSNCCYCGFGEHTSVAHSHTSSLHHYRHTSLQHMALSACLYSLHAHACTRVLTETLACSHQAFVPVSLIFFAKSLLAVGAAGTPLESSDARFISG